MSENNQEEYSAGGSRIYRHEDSAERDFNVPHAPEGWREAIEAHLEKHFGAEPMVFHEMVSTTIHLDLYIYPATKERPFQTLVTLGVADTHAHPPEEVEYFKYIELFCYLPADWPHPTGGEMDERYYWPYRTLKFCGRMIHEHETWLGPGHTVPNGDPVEPYAEDTQLCCAVFAPPIYEAEEFDTLTIDGKSIDFLYMVPITEGEMNFKLQEGFEALGDKLDDAGYGDAPINPAREEVATAEPMTGGEEYDILAEDEIRALLAESIRTTRDLWKSKQHRLGFFAKRKFKPKAPGWVKAEGGRFNEIYRDVDVLRRYGQVVWGQIVQANSMLFDPDEKADCPAALIYSLDPHYDENLWELTAIASILFSTKGESVDDAEMQRFADLLEDEREVQMKLPVPKSLTRGRDVFYTSIMVHRKQLLFPALVCNQLPMLVAPSQTEATMILPETFWSDELKGYWSFRLQNLLDDEDFDDE